METKTNRSHSWLTWSPAICAAIVAIVLLPEALVRLLQGDGGDPSFVAGVAIGIGALGILLGELGEVPSAPRRRRLYRIVQVLIAVSIVIVSLSLGLR